MFFSKKGGGGVVIKYRGKEYGIQKIKEEQRVRPLGEENDKSQEEITVKDYEVGRWNVTVNVNGETIIVGWGPIKHLTAWGSIISLLVIVICAIRRRSKKIEVARWRRIVKKTKKSDSQK